MKPKNAILIGLLPVVLMSYGWYLGQLHQSMQDLAGILLFITGAAGLVLGLAAYFALKRFAWRSSWWGSLLLGAAGCGVVFLVILVYARMRP